MALLFTLKIRNRKRCRKQPFWADFAYTLSPNLSLVRNGDRMKFRLTTTISLILIMTGCGSTDKENTDSNVALDAAAQARQIALESIIVDTHIDVPYRLYDEWEDVSVATDGGDFDYPRAVAGGLNAPFMSIYTPATLEAEGGSKARADELIDLVLKIVNSAPDKFAIARSADEVEAQFSEGLISFPLGMENGSPIEGDLANLQYFYERGIRYITLAHSLTNHISDSSYDDNKPWDGLSEFGEEVVKEMNRLGIMVDVSHVSDAAFYDVMAITDVPAIASHSSARHFTPDFERNMADDMIKILAENGGVIMINYGSSFVTAAAHEYSSGRTDAYKAYRADNNLEDTDALDKEFKTTYDESHGGLPFADIEDVLDHFDHVVALAGIDHVGIGSDYDGVGDSLPTGLKDVASYPNLVEGLLARGYAEEDVKKILGSNLLRVWRQVEAAAENASN
jgi:membrane dipeptidase